MMLGNLVVVFDQGDPELNMRLAYRLAWGALPGQSRNA